MEPCAHTTARFIAVLQHYDLDDGITWRCVGRVRHGLLQAYHNDLGPGAGDVLVHAFEHNTAI